MDSLTAFLTGHHPYAIATAPLFVKVSETGPVATAFTGTLDLEGLAA